MIGVHVIKARDLAGEERDLDPYVVIISGSSVHTTKVISKNKNPTWKEVFDVDTNETGKILITVWDKNYVSVDTFLGSVALEASTVKSEGLKRWYLLEERPGKNDVVSGEIKLHLTLGGSHHHHHHHEQDHSETKKTDAIVKQRVETQLRSGTLEIDLTSCDLTATPGPLKVRSDWTMIDMGFNKFVHFPDMSDFSGLQQLWLGGNQIQDMDRSITALVNLQRIYLNGNCITELIPEIAFMTSLQILDLSNNQLATLPSEIGLISKLEELLLGGNPIKDLPPELGNLLFLEKLDLNGCQLVEIPNDMTNMMRLLVLDLGTNQLRQLPPDMGNMSRLVELNLSDNRLTDLPLSMGNCVNLDKCLIERNDIKDEELLKKI